MDGYSNIDEVCADLNRLIDGFGFDLPSIIDRDLGRSCAMTFATGIRDRATKGIGSEGEWEPNSDIPEGKGYASMKERVYGVIEAPNDRTGDMLSVRALSNCHISHDQVVLEYGTGDYPEPGSKGRPVKASDLKKTDREKAYYAHTGQGPNGVTRPFYALDDDICGEITERCQERLDQYVGEVSRGT
jgi:hypothetical protein